MNVRAGENQKTTAEVARTQERHRMTIFVYDVFATVLLWMLALAYVLWPNEWGSALIVPVEQPIIAMWFGALAGCTISLKAIYDHAVGRGWDETYSLWHYGRPLSGAITGLMTYVLLWALDAGRQPVSIVIYAAAFVLGTQERRFFEFVFEVGRVIVRVPDSDKQLRITEFQPEQAGPGETVVVHGQGFRSDTEVKLDGMPLERVKVTTDGGALAGAVPQLPSNVSGPLDVTIANADGSAVVLEHKFTYRPNAPARKHR